MMTLIAAALAAQATPAASQPAQPMQQTSAAQHEGMKKDCCKDCCKDMAKGEHDMHASPPQPKHGE